MVNQVWDYQTKSCVQTLEGHTHNISAVCFHPELPIIITGSEDGTVRIWHSTTYRSLSQFHLCFCLLMWTVSQFSLFAIQVLSTKETTCNFLVLISGFWIFCFFSWQPLKSWVQNLIQKFLHIFLEEIFPNIAFWYNYLITHKHIMHGLFLHRKAPNLCQTLEKRVADSVIYVPIGLFLSLIYLFLFLMVWNICQLLAAHYLILMSVMIATMLRCSYFLIYFVDLRTR